MLLVFGREPPLCSWHVSSGGCALSSSFCLKEHRPISDLQVASRRCTRQSKRGDRDRTTASRGWSRSRRRHDKGIRPIFNAIDKGQPEVVELLIRNGAKVCDAFGAADALARACARLAVRASETASKDFMQRGAHSTNDSGETRAIRSLYRTLRGLV